jgi:hypothetical protein
VAPTTTPTEATMRRESVPAEPCEAMFGMSPEFMTIVPMGKDSVAVNVAVNPVIVRVADAAKVRFEPALGPSGREPLHENCSDPVSRYGGSLCCTGWLHWLYVVEAWLGASASYQRRDWPLLFGGPCIAYRLDSVRTLWAHTGRPPERQWIASPRSPSIRA